MDTFAGMFGAALFLALALEKFIELLVKPPLPERYYAIVPYIAAAFGLAVAFAFAIDLVTPFLDQFGVVPAVAWAGKVVTGLAIGGGSNLLHDLWPGE